MCSVHFSNQGVFTSHIFFKFLLLKFHLQAFHEPDHLEKCILETCERVDGTACVNIKERKQHGPFNLAI